MKSLTIFFKNLTLGKELILLISPLISLLVPMKLIVLGLFLLILVDLLTGIRKNLYIRGVKFNPFKKAFWRAIKSYLLRRTWRKTYEYVIGIVAVAVLEAFVLGGNTIVVYGKVLSLTELSIVIPAIVEVWSIGENLEVISGRNFLKKLLPLMPKPIIRLFENKTLID